MDSLLGSRDFTSCDQGISVIESENYRKEVRDTSNSPEGLLILTSRWSYFLEIAIHRFRPLRLGHINVKFFP